ncbi:MAG: MotA/TolQ/ExbB proton channel family protein [Geminicoccaceae bacterium]|nr:MotA/TolQ/ExbB proton channel family protein [Geminicoccaceae bacterium]MCX8101453.1 MotA/TolQ/ExbB proton channel family protein [Geminicoccaceae bacterium]MDW8368697.1 MotA/TolQ/ExbB proton channel family protein [Geminicoccaceae bacterium]
MSRIEAVAADGVGIAWPGPTDWVQFGRAVGRRKLLLLRFALLNLVAAALLAAAAAQGWLDEMIESDRLHLVKLICLVFLVGLASAGWRAAKLSTELDALEAGRAEPGSKAAWFLAATAGKDAAGRAAMAALLRLKLGQRLAHLRYLANLLVLLGLIGTVVGFILALAGIDPATVGDPSAIGPMVSRLLEGMAVALYTTLAGSLLNIWLSLNCRFLEGGTAHLYARLVERSENDARL